jgi:hypothetical protein
MKCHEVENQISAYLENELPEELRRAFADHIEQCESCSRLYDKLESLIFELHDLEEEMPFHLRNRLYNLPLRLEPEAPRLGRWLQQWISPKWVAAAVGSIILSFNLLYFTNVLPPANRSLHLLTANVEKWAGEAGGFFEKVKESKDFLVFTFFSKKPADVKEKVKKKAESTLA